MKKLLPIIIFITVIVTGCASTPSKPLDTEAVSKINSVSISNDVTLPEFVDYQGIGVSLGAALGGVLGALIADSDTSESDILTFYMRENNIDVAKMVEKEFEQQLPNSQRFTNISSNENTDAEFKLTVTYYGLVKGWGIFSVQPVMRLNAKLIGASGSLLWEKTVVDNGFDDEYKKQPLEDWLADPSELEKGFNTASKKLVAKLITDLNQ